MARGGASAPRHLCRPARARDRLRDRSLHLRPRGTDRAHRAALLGRRAGDRRRARDPRAGAALEHVRSFDREQGRAQRVPRLRQSRPRAGSVAGAVHDARDRRDRSVRGGVRDRPKARAPSHRGFGRRVPAREPRRRRYRPDRGSEQLPRGELGAARRARRDPPEPARDAIGAACVASAGRALAHAAAWSADR